MAVGAASGALRRRKMANNNNKALAGAGPRTHQRTTATSRAAGEAFPSPFYFVEEVERRSLKKQLLAVLADSDRGVKTTLQQRISIEKLIDKLSALNLTAVAGARLSGRWQLLWTTEKETLAITGGGILGKVTDVFQIIDARAGTLSNNIVFEDGTFAVGATFKPSDGKRVYSTFESASVRLAGFTFAVPPIGNGWFDCVYLDDDMQIVRDSRGDALILRLSSARQQQQQKQQQQQQRQLV
ncbi:unnamed protein product [Polarella glacialis]|uniref:Plastid lipid-associated protein/fibrillin conserved domain-containing protein n=1 Tax=Polarella glacialis TaxID=89957 RepID=A0A813GUW3_POLGL|nr:unnamed protein product [Polarella glacialis]